MVTTQDMKLRIIPFLAIIISLSSCASYGDLNQSLKFEEDDIYFTNDFQHRMNKQTLLMNENVAMPDSAWDYYDEAYANSIRPSYAKRIDKFESTDSTSTYMANNEKETDYNSNSGSRFNSGNNNWLQGVSIGVGAGAYYGYNAYYNGYQPNYYRPSNTYNTSYVNQRNAITTPAYYESSYNRFTPGASSRIVTPQVSPRATKPYINPNPGYNSSNTDRQYRTRSSSGQNNGYQPSFNSSRTGGGATPAGRVNGYRRR